MVNKGNANAPNVLDLVHAIQDDACSRHEFEIDTAVGTWSRRVVAAESRIGIWGPSVQRFHWGRYCRESRSV